MQSDCVSAISQKTKEKSILDKLFFVLLVLLFFAIPIEHRYDKLFRIYSHSLIPEGLVLPSFFDKKIFFYLSDFAVWILFGWMVEKRTPFLKRGGVILLCFLLVSLHSILFSALSDYPLIYIHFFEYLTPFLLYLFLANGPIEGTSLFKGFAWGLFATSCLQSLLALLQYFLQRPLGLRLLNERAMTATIKVPNGRLSLLDSLFPGHSNHDEIFRAIGTLSHPNLLGGVLVTGILLTSFLLWAYPRWRKWIASGYFLQLSALGVTFSRAAIFSLLLGTTLWFCLMRKEKLKGLRISLAVFFFSVLLGGVFFSEQYLHRGGIVNYTEFSAASDQERISFQKIAMNLLADHPFRGVGFEQFGFLAVKHSNENSYLMAKGTVHNIYLLLAVEIGIFGLLIFCFWVFKLLRNALKNRSQPEVKILLCLLLVFLFIGCVDFYPLFSHQGRLLFFSVAGFLARFTSGVNSRLFIKRAFE